MTRGGADDLGYQMSTDQPNGEFSQRKIPEIRPGDMVIAVMGVTGSGKSTFIQYFSNETLVIGHDLESCTGMVGIWPCSLPDGTKLFLIDTPGFDDTHKTDTDILREVAAWLSEAYTKKIELAGIVYLHRILDVRLGGSAMRNLRMFKKLCGDSSLGSVVLATTMWSNINEQVGREREMQLQERREFWKYMTDQGSKVFRQDRGRESALEIVNYLIAKKRPVTLDIQRDMVDKNLTLDQTAAGQEVQADIAKQREHYEKEMAKIREEMIEALARRDYESQEELNEYKAEIEAKMAHDREDLIKMQADKDELRRQMDEEHARERQEFMEQIRETERKIMQDEAQLEMMRQGRKYDLELQELKFRLETEKAERLRVQKKYDESCVMM